MRPNSGIPFLFPSESCLNKPIASIAPFTDLIRQQIEDDIEKTRIRVSDPKKVMEYVGWLSSKLAST